MAEQGGDIGARLFAQGQLGGSQSKADDSTNSDDALQIAAKGAGKAVFNASKAIGLPVNLSGLGETSITQPLDSEGISGKMMPSLFNNLNTGGGFLAKLLHDIFIKNREVTDHTTGVGGDASGSGSDYGNSGSSGISHFDGGGGDFSAVSVSALPTGDMRFDYSEASMPVGGFTPSHTPVMGTGAGAGMDM